MQLKWTVALACLLAACSGSKDESRAMPGDGESSVASKSASTEAYAAPEVPADAPLVAFLGDSIAAGLHLPAGASFPAVLQRSLARDGLPFRLINAGVSGDTSAGGLRRVDWVLQQSPQALVVELGGNDGLRGQDVAGVESNLREIVRRARAKNVAVLLLGVRLPPTLGSDYVSRFEAVYAAIAASENVPFVPFFMQDVGGVPEMLLEDGLHHSPAGHERIARNVAPKLRELIAGLSASTR